MKKTINNVTIGADPEVFLRNVVTGEIVSAEGIIGGTKEEPKSINKKGYCVQEDNVMAEFCIPPCTTEDEFFHTNSFMLNYLKANTPTELDVAVVGSAILDPKYLQSEQSKTFGCDPDYDAHTLLMNMSPQAADNQLRTAGGHIHVGYSDPNEDLSVEIIKSLDLYLGVPSIVMDWDKRRREMYGKAGAFRLKDYGVEYRTLSNFWLRDEEHIRWAFNNALLAIDKVNKGEYVDSALSSEITDAINYDDIAGASELIGAMNIPFIEPRLQSQESRETVKVKSKKELVKA